MRTAALEAKLLQQLTAMREMVLFNILLELQKAYGDLDWERCLEILAAYMVGIRIIQLIWIYWNHLTMVARAGVYF